MSAFSFLDRENTIAPPGYSRWLVTARRARGSFVHRSGLFAIGFQLAAVKIDRR